VAKASVDLASAEIARIWYIAKNFFNGKYLEIDFKVWQKPMKIWHQLRSQMVWSIVESEC
jgi:hypothetical protein